MTDIPRITSFLGGEAAPAGSGEFDLVQPQDRKIVGRIVEAGEAGVAAAVSAAKAAYTAHRHSPVHSRAKWLRDAGAVLRKAVDEVAPVISADVGKPIRVCRGEVLRGAEFLEAVAAALPQINGEVLPLDATASGAGHFGFTRRVPFGVVAGIIPFNGPVNLLVQKIGPAVAAGNAIVAKPAPAGTRTALMVASMFQERAGWPKGLFTVLTGDKESAAALVAHPDVRAVSFTGGTAGGDALIRLAGAKKFLAELGSNAANIVLADADLADAAKKIAGAAFEASGQQCISAQRVLVEQPAFDAFLQAFVAAAKQLKVGPVEDPSTDIGPMVNRASADRVMAMCREAIERGAKFALEPRQKDAEVTPGILVDVSSDARLWQEEVFGPVALVRPFADVEHGLKLANDSAFGLQGAVFTRSLATAFRFAQDFEVGSIWINEPSRFRVDSYPFGGVKASGIGREGIRYAIEELSQLKFIGIKP
ncbi:MAG: aldehyde dehydrogenase family protein [Hyphomicrobiaceae bacterium]